MSAVTMTEETNEERHRRRNPGAGRQPGQVARLLAEERTLRRIAKRLGEVDRLYRERDQLIIEMYDHGYTHRQIADLMNDASETQITYDAVGRIIRLARSEGIEV